ncbi:MAG: glycosyltransferase [Pseudomonadales bacterium]|nr:glycosyltransferase [Pseudomonadales bacterium]
MLLSIIIPLAKDDESWQTLLPQLLPQLQLLDEEYEIILAGAEVSGPKHIKTVFCDQGRAATLNAAANTATGKWLWFIHADTIIDKNAQQTLFKLIKKPATSGLHYFQLDFHTNNAFLSQRMKLNSLGVKFRSHYLKSPFGDQAFCIDHGSFTQLHGYDTNQPYGEDHFFVWLCHLNQIPVTALTATVSTSARKYEKGGWFFISLLHNWLWFKQWLPLFIRWLWKSYS